MSAPKLADATQAATITHPNYHNKPSNQKWDQAIVANLLNMSSFHSKPSIMGNLNWHLLDCKLLFTPVKTQGNLVARRQILERAWVKGFIIFVRVDPNPTQNVQVLLRTRSRQIYSSSQVSIYFLGQDRLASELIGPIFVWPKLNLNDIRVQSSKK